MALGKEEWADLLYEMWRKGSDKLPGKSLARVYIKFFKEWEGDTKFFNKSRMLDDDLQRIRNWMTHTTYGKDILSHLSIQQQEMIAQRSPKIFREIFSQSVRVGNPQNISKKAVRHTIQNVPVRLKKGMAYWYRLHQDKNKTT